MSVKFGKVGEMPVKSIKACEARVAQCWAEIHDAEAQLTFQMSKGGKPDYDKQMVEHYMNLLETRKTCLRQALEMLVYALKEKLNEKKPRKTKTVNVQKTTTKKKVTKKAPGKQQKARH